jgi:hypothetical protein
MDNFNTIKEIQEEYNLDNSHNNKRDDKSNYKQVEVQISDSGIAFDNYSFFKQDSLNKAEAQLQLQNA